MQIFIRGSRTFVVDLARTDTVLSVKETIHDREGIPARFLILYYGSHVLDRNEATLADYDIQTESTIRYCLTSGNVPVQTQ